MMDAPQMKPNPNSGPMPTSPRTSHRKMTMTMKRMIIGLLGTIGVLLASPVYSATQLPPGKQCFNDPNGDPVAAGTVGMYVPTTLTAKDTWQNVGETTLNIDPVPLDSAGCALIYGNGTYRQLVKDSLGNTIWDRLTYAPSTNGINWGGTSGGTANAQIITALGFTASDGQVVGFRAGFTNSGAATLTTTDGGTLAILKDTPSGPVVLTGGEITTNNVVLAVYVSADNSFHVTNPFGGSGGGGGAGSSGIPISPPGGRLTLTSGVPVLMSDVTAATSVYYTPYIGNGISVWSGVALIAYGFTELTQALDPNPAHTGYQQSGKNFDEFIVVDAGVLRLCTGPAWSSDTVRGTGAGTTELEYKLGVLANKVQMVCRWGSNSGDTLNISPDQASYVGSIRATANGTTAMVMQPAAASGGTAVVLGVWNAYNRVQMQADVQDNGNNYTYGSGTIREARNSTGNQISLVSGQAWESLNVSYKQRIITDTSIGDRGKFGVGLDSTTTYFGNNQGIIETNAAAAQVGTLTIVVLLPPQLGWHVVSANENSGSGTNTYTTVTQNAILAISGPM